MVSVTKLSLNKLNAGEEGGSVERGANTHNLHSIRIEQKIRSVYISVCYQEYY